MKELKRLLKGSIYKKNQLFATRSSLLTISKLFVRFHLGYGEEIYAQPNNSRLLDKI